METKREKSRREKRMAAYLAIAQDPVAEVRCPKCHAGTLFILADVVGEDHIEKWIQCDSCFAMETLLLSTQSNS
ncbi:hypothetical protein [Deinococcus aquatilis]|jgi:hypothetical protein|uniref:hypothetical protein n=1 Tax=Deinococcus aquatilis TaxID=519440 RepID=UPI0012FBB77E|nr:hypothetical protein [Deinococcus aquatilis]